jgi:hypothetical protein
MWIALQKRDRRHNHAWCTETALEAMHFPKTFLHGVQLTVWRQAFNRHDSRTISLGGENRTTFDRLAVHMYDTCTALACVAANMSSSKSEVFAQEIHEEQTGFYFRGVSLTIDCDRNRHLGRRSRCTRHAGFYSFRILQSTAETIEITVELKSFW